MIKVEKEIIVPASIDQLFAYIANFENDTKWNSNTISVGPASSEPIGLDTIGKGVTNVLGRDYAASFTYNSYDPPNHVSRQMITDPLVIELSSDLKETDMGEAHVIPSEHEMRERNPHNGASKVIVAQKRFLVILVLHTMKNKCSLGMTSCSLM